MDYYTTFTPELLKKFWLCRLNDLYCDTQIILCLSFPAKQNSKPSYTFPPWSYTTSDPQFQNLQVYRHFQNFSQPPFIHIGKKQPLRVPSNFLYLKET